MQKAILLSLDDTYEEELISSTGKHKEDYIGQVGNIVHQQNICVLVGTTRYLYDIEFNDGARFCVDREQIEFIKENERLMFELENKKKELVAYRCMYSSSYEGFEETK